MLAAVPEEVIQTGHLVRMAIIPAMEGLVRLVRLAEEVVAGEQQMGLELTELQARDMAPGVVVGLLMEPQQTLVVQGAMALPVS